MPRLNPLSAPSRLRERRHQRSRRLLASRAVAETLVSVAGAGRPSRSATRRAPRSARSRTSSPAGTAASTRPSPGSSCASAAGSRSCPRTQIEMLAHREVVLRSARLDLADFERREGEVLLVEDVIDHQLVDVDGVRVIRAADLYLAKVGAMYRLVGVDVSVGTLLRRLGPTRWRARPDARAGHRLGRDPAVRPARAARCACARATTRCTGCARASSPTCWRSSGARERQELLAALEPETAADALEEMDAEELEPLLRESGDGAGRRAARGDGARRGRRRAARPRARRARASCSAMMPDENGGRAATAARLRGAHRRRLDDEHLLIVARERHRRRRCASRLRRGRRAPGRRARRARRRRRRPAGRRHRAVRAARRRRRTRR